ncbi:uncharacterized protein LOC107037955 [Diachasma alloeum]|uniref:uncharacterized protein LOC107037955 n=1 Tax=Diachasma alloeum TaxID=454923 RepID=UPI0007384448|nr:uncharacterized protein LOC107037955 [Diachasma alloeum]
MKRLVDCFQVSDDKLGNSPQENSVLLELWSEETDVSMATSLSSVSHCSRTKVTRLGKSSLVLVVPLLLGLKSEAVTSTVQVQWNQRGITHCDFRRHEGVYGVADLLSCMNDLASQMVGQRFSRRIDEGNRFLPASRRTDSYGYVRYPPHPERRDYRPNSLYRESLYPDNLPSPHRYPPALPPGYPLEPTSNYSPGILGVNLLDALSSISQYDDRKCVPRILCEVATGVVPGNSEYKQSYGGFGMNSLVSLLTAFDVGGSSPLLTFGKSALMGYTNRGNPDVCYRQYPRCPREPSAVVDYLNNHNGGFFRFFRNRNSGLGYRAAVNHRPAPPPGLSGPESDRKGTGSLRIDGPSNNPSDLTAYEGILPEAHQTKEVVFPDSSSKREAKSLNFRDQISFFPQVTMSIKASNHSLPNHDDFISVRSSRNQSSNIQWI